MTPYDLMNAWNVNRGEMRLCSTIDFNGRKELAALRVAEVDDLPRWVKAIQRAGKSAFLTGRVIPAEGQTAFVATFDWLLKPGTLTKIEEGIFDQRVIEAPISPNPQRDSSYWGTKKPPKFSVDDPLMMKAILRAADRMRDLEMAQKRHLSGSEQQRIIDEEVGKNIVEVTTCERQPVAVASARDSQPTNTAASARTPTPERTGRAMPILEAWLNGKPTPEPSSTPTSSEERWHGERPANHAAGSTESKDTTSRDTSFPSSSNGSAADATAENMGREIDPEETLDFPF